MAAFICCAFRCSPPSLLDYGHQETSVRGALRVLRSHVWCLVGRSYKKQGGPGLLLSTWMSQVPLDASVPALWLSLQCWPLTFILRAPLRYH